MEPLAETATVFNAEWRRSLRSGRVLVLLALYLVFTALILLIVGVLTRGFQAILDAQLAQGGQADMTQAVQEQGHQAFLQWMLHTDDPGSLKALLQVPLVVLIVFRLTLLFLPLYVALMGFDQVSGEVGPRSIRYLTVRARRSSILFGKFLGQGLVLLALVAAVDVGIFAYAKAQFPQFSLGVALAVFPRLWLAAVVYSLAYVALTTLCSTLFRQPAVSLLANVAALFLFWLLEAIGAAQAARHQLLTQDQPLSPWAGLRYLSPSHYGMGLLHPAPSEYGPALAAYVGFAALFLGLAWLAVRRRDL